MKKYYRRPDIQERIKTKRATVEHKKYMANWSVENDKTVEGRAYRLWNGAKQSAKKKKIEFDLDKGWIEKKVEKGRCELTNIKFEFERSKSYSRNVFVPSIDRIDSRKGYVKSNCQIILWGINQAKNDMDMNEFREFINLVWEGMNETSH